MQPIIQVDAFTAEPFGGNPAAVCVLGQPRDAGWMQQVAAEMNLSETAFLLADDGEWRLRWFTPTREVELCGHATLASAHVLFEQGLADRSSGVRFGTMSGRLSARFVGGWIEMDFPAEPADPAEPPPELLGALGCSTSEFVGRNRMDYLVQLSDASAVRALRPDFGRLAAVENTRGVIVTALSDDERYDFVSRYFAPAYGVAEDPVTGSAHCCLAPFWAQRIGRDELVGWQASRRGGAVRVRDEGRRVRLTGQAVTTLRGELLA